MTDKQLRVQWRMWKTCKGLPHHDYAAQPGTDEGDCATAYRSDRLAEIERQAATLKAQET